MSYKINRQTVKAHVFEEHDPIWCECGWYGLMKDMIRSYNPIGAGDIEPCVRCPQCKADNLWELDRERMSDDGDIKPEYSEDDWRIER